MRSARAESGYRSVYRAHEGKDRWIAKVRVRGRLTRLLGSASHLPHQAALHAALWYRARYGARWLVALASGRKSGQSARRVWRLRSGGYAARVWEYGRPVEVTGVRRPGRDGGPFDALADCVLAGRDWRTPGRLLIFRTEADAWAAVRKWVDERFGRAAEAAVWRW